MRLFIIAALILLSVACAPRAQTAPQPTSAVAVTAAPRAPTATPQPDYRGMRMRLSQPLSAMVVSLRGNDRSTTAAFLAKFNTEADEILPRLETDMSKSANALHSAIVNVRSHPGDQAALDQDLRSLLKDIP